MAVTWKVTYGPHIIDFLPWNPTSRPGWKSILNLFKNFIYTAQICTTFQSCFLEAAQDQALWRHHGWWHHGVSFSESLAQTRHTPSILNFLFILHYPFNNQLAMVWIWNVLLKGSCVESVVPELVVLLGIDWIKRVLPSSINLLTRSSLNGVLEGKTELEEIGPTRVCLS